MPAAASADCTPANDLVGTKSRVDWVEGGLVYDTTNDVLKTCDGTNWQTISAGAASSGLAGYLQFSNGAGGFANSGATAGQQLFWDNTSKRLGIGTATPSYSLSISGGGIGVYGNSSQFPTGLAISPSTHATSRRAAMTLDDWSLLQDSNGDGTKDFLIYQSTPGVGRLSISATGNVGLSRFAASNVRLDIGTASATDETVRVTSQGYAGLQLVGDSANTTGEPGGAYVSMAQDGGAVTGLIGVTNTNAQDPAGTALTDAINNGVIVSNRYAGPLQLATNGAVRLTIDSSGNVGVGGAPTTYKLSVTGDIFATNWLRTSGNNGWYNDTHGGGWHMSDATWMRVTNGKPILAAQSGNFNHGVVLQLETNTTGNNGPRIGFHKASAKVWAIGLGHGDANNQRFVMAEDAGSTWGWGTERFRMESDYQSVIGDDPTRVWRDTDNASTMFAHFNGNILYFLNNIGNVSETSWNNHVLELHPDSIRFKMMHDMNDTALKQGAADLGDVHRLPSLEGVIIGDDNLGLIDIRQHVRR